MNNQDLKPCPFCGGVDVEINESKVWAGLGWGGTTSASIIHHCPEIKGQPSRKIERIGRDRASAIAAWNMRAPLAATAPQEQEISEARYLDILNAEGVR